MTNATIDYQSPRGKRGFSRYCFIYAVYALCCGVSLLALVAVIVPRFGRIFEASATTVPPFTIQTLRLAHIMTGRFAVLEFAAMATLPPLLAWLTISIAPPRQRITARLIGVIFVLSTAAIIALVVAATLLPII